MTSDTPPPPPPERMVSKRAFRTLERSSELLFAMASTHKGSQISRISLAANEALREICERKVDKATLEQLEFFVNTDRLREHAAEPLLILAQSILAIARSIGGLEDTVAPPQAPARPKPPLDFGDVGLENIALAPSGTWVDGNKNIPLFRNFIPADADLNTSDNTETSADTADKPVSGANDYIACMEKLQMFRPITPDGEVKARSISPSPAPSPKFRAQLKRKAHSDDSEEDEEEEEDDEGDAQMETTASSSMEKDGFQCVMCDTVFYARYQLDSHLVGYHRMKPTFGEPQDAAQASASIVSTRALNGFTVERRQSGGGGPLALVKEPVRLSTATVTSPGGTVRHYSSPSNAARAAAKAAAAVANGTFRPNLPSKPYTCRQCGVVLTSQQMYASHVRYNHPKEKLGEAGGATAAAPARQRSSGNKETAIVHLLLDDGTKAFKCRRCDKVFDSAQKVAGHSRHCLLVFEGKARPANQGPVPTEDRPYTVYRCGLNSDLARTCPYCGELMPSSRKVDKHVRLMHEASRHEVYGCSTCDRRFVTLGGIENHWLHYGDCPQGVLTVHKDDGTVTCADIGECPPPIKRPRYVVQAQPSAVRTRKEVAGAVAIDDDPTVAIVNAIMAAHRQEMGKDLNAPDLSPELGDFAKDGGATTEDEEETAPQLDEYGGEGEMLNGDSHLDEEMEEEDKSEAKKMIVSMKLIKCKQCEFMARTRDAMDEHMTETHPEAAEDDDGLPTTTSASPELNDDVMNGSTATIAAANGKTKQTGEMRRMLGIGSD